MKRQRIFLLWISLLLSGYTFAADCQLSYDTRLEPMLDQVKQRLSHKRCKSQYFDYFEQLLQTAAGQPDATNRSTFRSFLGWSVERSLLTEAQGKNLYNRYFNTTFVSVNQRRAICTLGHHGIESMFNEMQQELADKKRGLYAILNDKDAYFDASRQLISSRLVIGAAAIACTEPVAIAD